MKINELRIGNLVKRKGEIIKFEIADFMQLGECVIFEEDIEGIEISTELLISAGFEKQPHSWFHKSYFTNCLEVAEKFTLAINSKSKRASIFDECENPDYGMMPTYATYDFEYFHQVQNMWFALTNEELEFKNENK